MFNKFNILNIIKKHFSTFKTIKGQNDIINLLFYIFLPLLLSCFCYYEKCYITENGANLIIAVLAILGGFLLALPINLLDIYDKFKNFSTKDNDYIYPEDEKRIKYFFILIEETYYNIAFCCVLCILAIISTALSIIFIKCDYAKILFSCINYYFYGLFLLTILMITRRVFLIFETKLKYQKRKK